MSEETARRRIGQEMPPKDIQGQIQVAPQQPIGLVGPYIDVPAPGIKGFHVDNDGLAVEVGNFSQGGTVFPGMQIKADIDGNLYVYAITDGTLASGELSWRDVSATAAKLVLLPSSDAGWAVPVFTLRADNTASSAEVRLDAQGGAIYLDSTVEVSDLIRLVDVANARIELTEASGAPAGSANTAKIYAIDNGGKTQLMVVFGSGDAQQLAIEP